VITLFGIIKEKVDEICRPHQLLYPAGILWRGQLPDSANKNWEASEVSSGRKDHFWYKYNTIYYIKLR
jgi:hypothetical protein